MILDEDQRQLTLKRNPSCFIENQNNLAESIAKVLDFYLKTSIQDMTEINKLVGQETKNALKKEKQFK